MDDQAYFFFALVTGIILSSAYVIYRKKGKDTHGDFLACIAILGLSVAWFPFLIMGLALGMIYGWIKLITWASGK